ncbi:MAG TPA: ABC transporter permease subunit [Acidimicrobiales bacterium]
MTGVLTVARLEFTVRVRAGRWRWLLGGWFVILVIFTVLLRLAIGHAQDLASSRGTVMYGGLELFQLALALLVMPALTGQSVNGDRERGTLGVLQVTKLSAFDIAAGKLLAAWGTACVFLLTSAPLVAWSMLEGGVPVIRVVVVSIVVAVLLWVICAVSLGLSSVLSRSTTSSVLSYLFVFGLTIGTVILFGLSTALTVNSDGTHSNETWWLLAPNPFVILADAAPVAPVPPPHCRRISGALTPGTLPNSVVTPLPGSSSSGSVNSTVEFCDSESMVDPLGSISRSVRDLRTGPGEPVSSAPYRAGLGPTVPRGGLVWPYGLGFDLGLGGFMLFVTTKKLESPRRHLPRGVRLA